nr:CD99 antigen-like protein 2 isoform X2 [Bubalus bubalis]
MVAWRWACLICLAFSLTTLVQRGSGDTGGFRLEDAVEGTSSIKRPPAEDDFNLADALDDQNDRDHGRKKPSIGGGGFSDKDLEDVVGGGDYKPDKGKGGGQYGGGDNSDDSGMSAETGTIAGVASALAMALIGAVSSYISYQQKKFCFSIQRSSISSPPPPPALSSLPLLSALNSLRALFQVCRDCSPWTSRVPVTQPLSLTFKALHEGLNADYMKGENLEAVVCEEPQVKYSALQTQSTEPPPPEPPRI